MARTKAADGQAGVVPSGMLGTAIFVATEAMFFAGLISAYLVLRAQAVGWPPFDQPRLPVGVTAINTLVLLASGVAMHRALGALRRGERSFTRWLGATAVLGAVFVAVQGIEWVRLVEYGLTTSSSLYGATFYTLVGAHGLHVLAAIGVLGGAYRIARRGGFRTGAYTGLEPFHLYWLFVVAVWPVLYVLVYLV